MQMTLSIKSIRKQLIAAVAMLLVAAIALGSSTYAWFSMNSTVEATNMQVQAVAEKGLLINEIADASSTTWDSIATTSQNSAIQLHATSTANTSAWYVAYSKVASDSASATSGTASGNLTSAGYATVGGTLATAAAAEAGTNAQTEVYYVDANGNTSYDNGEGYYVKYTYYLKSSGDAITLGTTSGAQNLNIKAVNVTGNTGSAALDKAIRVAVVVGGKAYIYAPLADNDTTDYYVNASSTATTAYSATTALSTGLTSLPAKTVAGTPVYIYIYFEGEDTNLNTNNITSTLDSLVVKVQFELVTNAAAVTDKGVTV